MVISKRIKTQELDKVISQGGHVSADQKKGGWISIQLRLSNDMIESIGSSLKDRIGLSRNAWILEAIQEKLKRENENLA